MDITLVDGKCCCWVDESMLYDVMKEVLHVVITAVTGGFCRRACCRVDRCSFPVRGRSFPVRGRDDGDTPPETADVGALS
jgi:hypothetical protein